LLGFRAEELRNQAIWIHCQQSRANVSEYTIDFVPSDEIAEDSGFIEVEHLAHIAGSLITLHPYYYINPNLLLITYN
jgi:hypothetical protein